MKTKEFVLASLLLLIFSKISFASTPEPVAHASSQNSSSTVRYWYRNYETSHSYSLLNLALQKTEDLYGKTTVIPSLEITQGRALAQLKLGTNELLDIINFVPDDDRIKHLRPIYVAGEEGLIGKRLCIIRKGTESLFKGIRTLEDLKKSKLVIGQGAHWPDTQILRDNGVSVVTNVSFEGLFRMLEKGRFHCYLRGAHEISEDLEKHGSDQLTIEPNLLFAYPSASIFFVSKQNIELAHRIELGLRRAIIDRDYHRLFHQNYAIEIEALNLQKRRIIRMNNSLLSNEVILKSTKRALRVDGKIDE